VAAETPEPLSASEVPAFIRENLQAALPAVALSRALGLLQIGSVDGKTAVVVEIRVMARSIDGGILRGDTLFIYSCRQQKTSRSCHA
jgi:hypothetical protein